jgi:hypothetical protein
MTRKPCWKSLRSKHKDLFIARIRTGVDGKIVAEKTSTNREELRRWAREQEDAGRGTATIKCADVDQSLAFA